MDEIDLYFKAFNGTNEICKTVCDYADRIVKEIKNVETLWDQAINNENSHFFMRMKYLPRRSQ